MKILPTDDTLQPCSMKILLVDNMPQRCSKQSWTRTICRRPATALLARGRHAAEMQQTIADTDDTLHDSGKPFLLTDYMPHICGMSSMHTIYLLHGCGTSSTSKIFMLHGCGKSLKRIYD